MKRILIFLVLANVAGQALAADIDPSVQKVPDQFINPHGKRFSIFAGDPERVQRANEVNVHDFTAQLDLGKPPTTLADLKNQPTLDISFIVSNGDKRSYILSFPDAQRYDILITDSTGKTVYTWSADKIFVKEIGRCFVNKDDKLLYKPNPPVDLTSVLPLFKPGVYKVKASLSNYPEITTTADWVLQP